jgi:hypothetical protein
MIFLSGTISLLQMTLLPGLLLLRFIRLPSSNFLQKLVSCFGISLVANYAAVYVLTVLRLYRPGIVWGLILIEVVSLVYLYRRELRIPFSQLSETTLTQLKVRGLEAVGRLEGKTKVTTGALRLSFLLLALALLVLALDALSWYFGFLYKDINGVFKTWDAIFSWNYWATIWSQNTIPKTMLYPQLIPTNWSISYILMGNRDVQLFARAIMPLFPFLTLVMMFDLAWSNRSIGALAGLIVARYMIKRFMGEFITDGYVDTALMFFGFLTIYHLLKTLRIAPGPDRASAIPLGAIFAAGGALTKQGGLYLLLAYPILALLLLYPSQPDEARRFRRVLGGAMLGALALILPSYLSALSQINSGVQKSGLGWTSWFIGERTLLDRFLATTHNLDHYRIVFLVALVGFLFYSKPYRWLAVVVLVPYSLAWSLFVGYEVRNLALVFPLVCLLFGLVLEGLVNTGLAMGQKLRLERIPVGGVVIILAAGLLAAAPLIPNEPLAASQWELQQKIIFPRITNQVDAALKARPQGTKVITRYPGFLPYEFRDSFIYNPMNNFDVFLADLSQYPDAHLLIVPKDGNVKITQYVYKRLDTDEYSLVFELGNWFMVERP